MWIADNQASLLNKWLAPQIYYRHQRNHINISTSEQCHWCNRFLTGNNMSLLPHRTPLRKIADILQWQLYSLCSYLTFRLCDSYLTRPRKDSGPGRHSAKSQWLHQSRNSRGNSQGGHFQIISVQNQFYIAGALHGSWFDLAQSYPNVFYDYDFGRTSSNKFKVHHVFINTWLRPQFVIFFMEFNGQ